MAILKRMAHDGRLIAFDRDPDAFEDTLKDDRLLLVRSNFRFLENFLHYYGYETVDGIIADLGVSSFQLDTISKGFSFRGEAALDMRMNPHQAFSAADFIRGASEQELIETFSVYGQVRNAKTLAKVVIEGRNKKTIKTINEFLLCISPVIMGNRTRYLAQVFQAVRIRVNDEINALKKLLSSSARVLGENGRLVVITYHSVEDRVVKHFMKSGQYSSSMELDFRLEPKWPFRVLTKKPIVPSEKEIELNPRSRSAKLRIAEKTTP
jgi:16S rRNA (cytosine1402-N4)-methyltransferase